MATLLADLPPSGPILDVGSGAGDLAIHLARLGHEVLAVDFVEKAVDQARERAASLPDEVRSRLRFEVADAMRPSLLGSFGAVVDSGFLHLLDAEESESYIDDVSRALRVGGRLYLHEFAVEFNIENVPRAVSEEELRRSFVAEKGWRLVELRKATFLNTVGPPTPAIAACIERLA
jgi:cyclopropane fatty-acyl-phospholipid synthase-like methyltransferase